MTKKKEIENRRDNFGCFGGDHCGIAYPSWNHNFIFDGRL